MSQAVPAVRPSDSSQKAEELMRTRQVRRLAVADDGGKIIGILSLSDLARHTGRRAHDLASDEVATTLSAIGQRPRFVPGVAAPPVA